MQGEQRSVTGSGGVESDLSSDGYTLGFPLLICCPGYDEVGSGDLQVLSLPARHIQPFLQPREDSFSQLAHRVEGMDVQALAYLAREHTKLLVYPGDEYRHVRVLDWTWIEEGSHQLK